MRRGRPATTARSPAIGDRLRNLRVKAGLSMRQLAEAAGVSVALISRIEGGSRYDPRLSTLKALARALDITAAELVRRLER